jgi:hypothetical protein
MRKLEIKFLELSERRQNFVEQSEENAAYIKAQEVLQEKDRRSKKSKQQELKDKQD